MPEKSILDGWTVEYKGDWAKLQAPFHSIVGSCPACGAPIYGQPEIAPGETPPAPVYSCACRGGQKSITDTMRTT